MALRDEATVVLGERLASRFMQYARPLTLADANRLKIGVDEQLSRVKVASAARAAQPTAVHCDGLVASRVATRVGSALLALLARYEEADDEGRAAIVGAARYFMDTHDLDQDLGSDSGMVDDSLVVNFVVRHTGLDVSEVPALDQMIEDPPR